MQVGVDVTYMHTRFGGCDPSGFGDMAMVMEKFNRSEPAQNIYASRD